MTYHTLGGAGPKMPHSQTKAAATAHNNDELGSEEARSVENCESSSQKPRTDVQVYHHRPNPPHIEIHHMSALN